MADETTTDTLAEIEGQAEPQPVQVREGRWRTRNGEVRHVTPTPEARKKLFNQSRYSWYDAQHNQTWLPSGHYTLGGESQWDLVEYLGPIEPDKTQELPDKTQELETKTQELPEYTPPEGWRVLQVGETIALGDRWVRPDDREAFTASRIGHPVNERMCYIRRIEPEPQPEPEPELEDCGFEGKILREQPQPVHQQAMIDSQAETIARLHSEIHALNMEIAEQQKAVNGTGAVNDSLRLQLEAVKAESAKRLQQVEELRSEVSYVQGLLGDEKRRFAELETLTSDLRAVNAATEKAMNSTARDKADLQHRLDTVAAEWALQAETIRGLESLLEAVKAELSQVSRDRYLLQIELDAAQQVPEPVSDRWEEGWDDGTARAVETIVEWLAPFRTCGSQALALAVMQNLPHIMRTLTGLTDAED